MTLRQHLGDHFNHFRLKTKHIHRPHAHRAAAGFGRDGEHGFSHHAQRVAVIGGAGSRPATALPPSVAVGGVAAVGFIEVDGFGREQDVVVEFDGDGFLRVGYAVRTITRISAGLPLRTIGLPICT